MQSYSMSTGCSCYQGEMRVSFLGALLGNNLCSYKVTLDLDVSVFCLVLLQLSQDHKESQAEDSVIQKGRENKGMQRTSGLWSWDWTTELTNSGILTPSCSVLFKRIHFPYHLNHFQFYFQLFAIKGVLSDKPIYEELPLKLIKMIRAGVSF